MNEHEASDTHDRPASPEAPSSTPAGSLRPGVVDAVEAVFALSDAIGDELSIYDLAAGCVLGIESGFAMIQIRLAMMSMAVQEAQILSAANHSPVTGTPSN